MCAKGRAAPELLGSPRRLTQPLRRTRPRADPDPGWIEITWDEALDEIAGRLGAVRDRDGAEAVAFAVTTPSGTPMVDSFEWVERFVRCFGSPNLIYAVEICGWHKDYAHALTFGRGTGAPDYDEADTIVLWGHNPTRTWLAQATRIADARRRGAVVAVVDPKRGGSGETADLWLPVRPGTDGALAMGAIRHLMAERSFDADFVRRWTNAPLLIDLASGRFLRASALWAGAAPNDYVVLGPDGSPTPYDTRRPLDAASDVQLEARVDLVAADGMLRKCATTLSLLAEAAAHHTPERVAIVTGLEPVELDRFYRLFAGAPRLSYHSWTGVGQHEDATQTERAIATLYALCGAVDRVGGNLWTVAPPSRTVNDYALLSPEQQRKALGLDELPLGPPSRGWITARDFCRAAIEGLPYRVRALMTFGTNFVVSQGDSSRNLKALRSLDFHAHVDMFLNPTAANADLVLPASMPWEREGLKIGFEITQEAVEHVQLRQAMVPVPGTCRADYDVAFALAARLGHGDEFFGGSIEAGWNHQLAPLGLTVADLRRRPEGVRVPQPCGRAKYGRLSQDGTVAGFATSTRRVELYSELLLSHGYPALPDHRPPAEAGDAGLPLTLSTAKSGWYVHSAYRHVASLRRKAPDPGLDLSPATAAARGIAEGDWVVVQTATGSARLRARLDGTLRDGVVMAEFGWWEDCPPLGRDRGDATGPLSSNINDALSDHRRDPVSGSVPLRAVRCEVSRDEAASHGRWAGERVFRVAAVRRPAADVAALSLRPVDGGPVTAFLPGQHVVLRSPALALSRAYSLTGGGRDGYDIAVGLIGPGADGHPAGRMSTHIHGLEPDGLVALEAPGGTFTPPLSGSRPVILLAAGIGITPFLAYVEALARVPPGRRPPGVHLIAVSRDGAHDAFGAELRDLAAATPGLALTRIYTRPRPEDAPERNYDAAGRSALASLPMPFSGRRPLAYICGGESFVADATAALVASDVPRFDVFAELFSARVEVPGDLAPRTVTLARSGRSFVWFPERGTLLDAADAAGFGLPSGCRAGQCESCSVKVLSGTVAHLSPYDGEADRCLTCRAVPVSDVEIEA